MKIKEVILRQLEMPLLSPFTTSFGSFDKKEFILVEANPDEIIYRRLNDDTRERDLQKVKDIDLHQQMNRATSMAYATLTGATVKIVENHDNHLDSNVRKLVNVLNL